ncbi:MAG: hypothetical protein HXS52_08060 [Theionarchaea archaeon]|nr:hypothetical protein [Theionarchaea archaeon]MBU7037871.1 hypothetical protein [Theionarchaea archaeon]
MSAEYFDQIGRDNTEKCIDLALKRAEELDIRYVVVASTTGYTIERVMELNPDVYVVCVTHSMGFKKEGGDEFEADRDELMKKGAKILTTTHLLAGLNRGVRNRYGTGTFSDIVADTLRMFSQGMKVCVEIAVMALDSGLTPAGEEVVVIGGTGRGADTAVVMMPSHSQNFFDTRVLEVICKPREG